MHQERTPLPPQKQAIPWWLWLLVGVLFLINVVLAIRVFYPFKKVGSIPVEKPDTLGIEFQDTKYDNLNVKQEQMVLPLSIISSNSLIDGNPSGYQNLDGSVIFIIGSVM